MNEAGWGLARSTRPPLFRAILLRELRDLATRVSPRVVLPPVAASLFAFAWNDVYGTDLYVPAIGGVILVVQAYRHRQRVRLKPSADESALWFDFGRDGAWLVDLIVLQGAAPTGVDRGMLWIENGRLFFVGALTSFGLQPCQAVGDCRSRRRIPGLREALTLSLSRRSGIGWMGVGFSPVMDPEEREEIEAAINVWSQGRKGIDGQYPPRTIGPSALPITGLATLAALNTLYWIGIAFYASRAGSHTEAFVRLVLGTAVAWPLDLMYPLLRWRALLDRRKLER